MGEASLTSYWNQNNPNIAHAHQSNRENRQRLVSTALLNTCNVQKLALVAIDSRLCEDATYRHVGLAAGVQCFGHRVHQVAADAEVAHLHLAQSVDQNVGGLHVCV